MTLIFRAEGHVELGTEYREGGNLFCTALGPN